MESSVSMNQQLFQDICQEVVMYMFRTGTIKEPMLFYPRNDLGLLDVICSQHITQQDVLSIRDKSLDKYLFISGMHALGVGICVIYAENDFKRSLEEFDYLEFGSLITAFSKVDAYELALNRMGISVNSGLKKVLDQIIIAGINTAIACVGNKIVEPENFKAFMQVLYNAGYTILYVNKEKIFK